MKFVFFLKSRLIFEIFYCFCMFVKKRFTDTGAYISESKGWYNAKSSAYNFYMRTNVPLNFRICISVPLKISQNLQENTCARDSFLIKLQAIKRESLAQVFSCEFREISKNNFFLQNTSAGCFYTSNHSKGVVRTTLINLNMAHVCANYNLITAELSIYSFGEYSSKLVNCYLAKSTRVQQAFLFLCSKR